MAGTRSPNFPTPSEVLGRSRSTLTTSTSLTCALTLYMPYVGGHVRILSFPGRQKHRSRASIASSEPTPRNRFSGLMGLSAAGSFRSEQKRCLRSI